jgi:phosphoadenosine phosphosulfate reductase
MTIFLSQYEEIAIERIQKFAKIAKQLDFPICVGFSGGKDSQVVYDLCLRSGIEFKAYFNRTFESNITLNFIRKYYPEVVWRSYTYGFIRNIRVANNGFLPMVSAAYCCEDYKHNPKHIDKCSILGIRRAESAARSKRTVFSTKNKTDKRKNSELYNAYFEENCQSVGSKSVISLFPIVDWSEQEVWDYIKRHNLPINPEYAHFRRVGCIVCPKANFSSNYKSLLRYPKLIDAFIRAREVNIKNNWIITSDKKDYTSDKLYYICRWLNHSFMPFTAKQEKYYLLVKEAYEKIHNKKV